MIKVMDADGIWHFAGHCFHQTDASWAAEKINKAIEAHNDSVCVNNIS